MSGEKKEMDLRELEGVSMPLEEFLDRLEEMGIEWYVESHSMEVSNDKVLRIEPCKIHIDRRHITARLEDE